jgi:hypothetical protein
MKDFYALGEAFRSFLSFSLHVIFVVLGLDPIRSTAVQNSSLTALIT